MRKIFKFLKRNKMVVFLLILFAWLINGKTLEDFKNHPRRSSECKGCRAKWRAYNKQRREHIGKCAPGWNQVGEAGADIAGCGLESCNARYRRTALSSATCAAHCKKNAKCNAYSWAPWNADKNHRWRKVCTIYDKQPNTKIGKSAGKWGKYRQVLCEKPQPKAAAPSYKIVKSGESCEAGGMTSITTDEDCKAAGLALGMSGKARSDQPGGGYTYSGKSRTANCTVHDWELPEKKGKTGVTQFFPKAGGACGTSSFNCLCKGK